MVCKGIRGVARAGKIGHPGQAMANLPAGSEHPSTAPAVRSIHYRRRWAYALWVALLLLSLGALVLWERPATTVTASYQVKVTIRQAPPGAAVEAWAGPWSRWTGPEGFSGAAGQAPLREDGSATLPVIHVPIARRRWAKGYIPRGTWDLVVLRFTAPGEAPRYVVLPLAPDIRSGLLRPRWRLTGTVNSRWGALDTAPQVPASAT
jgi:hypothetical protein